MKEKVKYILMFIPTLGLCFLILLEILIFGEDKPKDFETCGGEIDK
jgi:hypothetical protein